MKDVAVPVVRLLAVLGAFAALAGCGGSSGRAAASGSGPCGTAKPPPIWKHVLWIWMENNSYEQIIGNSSAPYLNRLARQCGLATDYQGVTHPSLPNYIAATSGGTWGIADDGPPSAHAVSRRSLFGQLAAAGKSWRSYEEGMPSACDLHDSGRYAVKHNPAAYYTDSRRACKRWDVPLGTSSAGRFRSDLRRNRLPAFSFVTPDLCNDMHDCSVSTGDTWLRRWVPKITASPGYRSGTTVLVITFDEGEGGSNRVATLVVSPSTRPGTTSPTPFDHYSLLKTTEQLLGLPARLGHAADRSTTSMRAAFHLG